MSDATRVLVTGASGFIGSHCIIQLLEKGYRVRGTLRNMQRADAIREIIRQHTNNADALEFAETDLTRDEGWVEAATGCPLILHVASPFVIQAPKHEEELIIPAREGTLRLLRAAKTAGARKVVLTSSVAAIAYGDRNVLDRLYTEDDWSNHESKDIEAYSKSKTLAERAAWDFVSNDNPGFDLAVINPGAVLGPILEKDYGTSAMMILLMLQGALPGVPRLGYEIVDVRDVANLHILAMESDRASGKRFPCVAGFRWFEEMSATLRPAFPDFGKKIPAKLLPNWMMYIAAFLGKFPKTTLKELGNKRAVSNRNAVELLGWNPRSPEEAIIATAQSLIDHGVVKP